ncbi:MAG: phosphoglycerate dehydrogenase [Actinomycetota bacterium]|nr:phosphoglycerate dehydrogenase [Actinomycetota bacterium]
MDKVLICSSSFGKFTDIGLGLLKKNNYKIIINELGRGFKEDDFFPYIKDIEGMIVGSMDEVTKKVIEAGKRLKVISVHGKGTDNIDIECATDHGVYVANAGKSENNKIAVADLTFGLILSIARNIPTANEMVKNCVWQRIVGKNVGKKVIGIIGAGEIGKEVIKRAKGFEMEVLVNDLFEDQYLLKNYKVKYTTLDYLLKNSDFISINVTLTSDTEKLISDREFNLMKPGAFLVNTSRGKVIDEKALYNALKENKIAGAAIDVYNAEPIKATDPLLKLDNIITTPHYGLHTIESLEEVDYISAKNVVDALRGEKLINALNDPISID